MRYRSLFDSVDHPVPRNSPRRAPRAAKRRREIRRLFLENLEDRNLLAFNVLAELATGPFPSDVALTSIDAGSQPDLVVLNSNDSVDVRLGNAGGAFGAAQTSTTGEHPRSFVTGDFTGDGIADLLTASFSDLSLSAGNGDGTFQPPISISLPPQIPSGSQGGDPVSQNLLSVATGDLNGDGTLDLAVAGQTAATYCPYYCYTTFDGYVNVLLGTGGGNFGAAATTRLGMDRLPAAIAVGDVNGDTDADVITANSRTNDLSVLLGDGSGAVGDPIHSGSGTPLRSISLGDVDGDGKVDTLTHSWAGGSDLVVQKGDGMGSFARMPSVNIGDVVNSAVLGDVNADGELDLVAVGSTNTYICTNPGYYSCYGGYFTFSRHATVVLGNGQGGFAVPLSSSLGSGMGSSSLTDLALADLTADGRPELATIDSNFGTAIILGNDGIWKPPAAISIVDASVVEGDGGALNAVFTVMVVGEHEDVTVDYSTGDNSAVAGADYTAQFGSLTYTADETTKQISIAILDDPTDEYDESFFVNIFHAVGGQITDPTAIGTIQDNDEAPLLTINDVAKKEGNRNYTPINFTVRLSQASGKAVFVEYATADGTATTGGSDYYATSGTLYFAPGSTTATINTSIRGDVRRELNETFFVDLMNATDATISDGQGQGTITNDDLKLPPPTPTIRISDAEVVEGNSGMRQMTFTVSLSNASDKEVLLAYATLNGTAKTTDNDYVAKSGILRFAPGDRTKTITISVKGDKKHELDEYFTLRLSGAVNATLADGQGVGTIKNDDGIIRTTTA